MSPVGSFYFIIHNNKIFTTMLGAKPNYVFKILNETSHLSCIQDHRELGDG